MSKSVLEFKPIGVVRSWYKSRNGTPRQSSICPQSKGVIELNKTFFDQPDQSLEGLGQFSHVWILFYFHENTNKKVRAKIRPPRLDGKTTGLFSTRSPHRPNAIGLSLTKLDKVEKNTIHVSGIDILDSTPVLDIKPYIHEYDFPKYIGNDESLMKFEKLSLNETDVDDEANINQQINVQVSRPDWISPRGVVYEKADPSSKIEVLNFNDSYLNNETVNQEKQFEIVFTERSRQQLHRFHSKNSNEHSKEHLISDLKKEQNFYLHVCKTKKEELSKSRSDQAEKLVEDEIESKKDEIESKKDEEKSTNQEAAEQDVVKCRYCYEFLDNPDEAKRAIENILICDPRSAYRRKRGSDKLYYFSLDTMHITCWFDENDKIIEIVKIKPNYL